ncbi:MAG TPA: oxygen-independent coproporphyrinogen III oxidase [Planctomycetota bacterium]|jgi:oxygen-independent coproporphyrinogen-3 oxidase|nr:oxygen-independent coproporphyrinogen III oxidase [Planctomycetota bacterium]
MSATPQISRALLEKYATSAPRYTSYPTAVDWSKRFEPSRYPSLLEQAAKATGPLSVYVHLPFCRELCLFCGCNVVISRNTGRYDAYLDALEKEFAAVRASGIGARHVRQYHWGGGTPTQFDLARLERVQAAFERTFTLDADAEVAIEVDPRVTSREQIAFLAAHGFNRVSMGVQDFNAAVQEAIKRVQSESETRDVVDAAREHGIASVNIDLIYGLPLQTPKSFETTVERVLDIRPERVALFHYAHVPWLKKHQTALEIDATPPIDVKFAMLQRSIEQFESAGYVYIGLDHFALPQDELAVALKEEKLQRNFMGYTTRRGDDLVALGVSSIGDVAGCYVQNQPKEFDYAAAVRTKGLAAFRGHELSPDDKLRRDVILGLMCNGILRKPAIESRHGIVFDTTFATELAELRPLEDDGLVRLEKDAIRLTTLGQMFMRNVALPFDRYFRERKASGGGEKLTFSKTL